MEEYEKNDQDQWNQERLKCDQCDICDSPHAHVS